LFALGYDTNTHAYVPKKISSASANAAFFGVPKIFVPKWSWLWSSAWPSGSSAGTIGSGRDEAFNHYNRLNAEWLHPANWTYFYDHSPLAKTRQKF
jgi:NTE family protein